MFGLRFRERQLPIPFPMQAWDRMCQYESPHDHPHAMRKGRGNSIA